MSEIKQYLKDSDFINLLTTASEAIISLGWAEFFSENIQEDETMRAEKAVNSLISYISKKESSRAKSNMRDYYSKEKEIEQRETTLQKSMLAERQINRTAQEYEKPEVE